MENFKFVFINAIVVFVANIEATIRNSFADMFEGKNPKQR